MSLRACPLGSNTCYVGMFTGISILKAKANMKKMLFEAVSLAWRSLWAAHDDIRQGRLVTVRVDYWAPVLDVIARMPNRRLTPQRVRVFIERLKDY